MHFGNFRKKSVKIGTFKKFWMPSGKRRVHSVSGRHDDDRCRNAPGVFRKASDTFLNFLSLPSRQGNCLCACRHRTKLFEVHYTPFTCTLKPHQLSNSWGNIYVCVRRLWLIDGSILQKQTLDRDTIIYTLR